VGCIGMTVDDFCQCTPSEFRAVYEGYVESEQRRERSAWERARMQCVTILQPYSKHPLDPRDVFRFKWDNEADGEETQSTEEIWANFDRVKKEQGLQ